MVVIACSLIPPVYPFQRYSVVIQYHVVRCHGSFSLVLLYNYSTYSVAIVSHESHYLVVMFVAWYVILNSCSYILLRPSFLEEVGCTDVAHALERIVCGLTDIVKYQNVANKAYYYCLQSAKFPLTNYRQNLFLQVCTNTV